MHGAQLREFRAPRFAIALAVIALFAAVLVPTAGGTSPSQDQYGSAIPGAGTGNGSGSPSTSSSPSGSAEPTVPETTIPVAPSSSSTTPTTSSEPTGASAESSSGGNRGGSSHADSKGGSQKKSNDAKPAAEKGSNNGPKPIHAQNTGQSVPHIAADSAGDSWVPFFIAGLLALGAAGAILVYRNRRRAAQS